MILLDLFSKLTLPREFGRFVDNILSLLLRIALIPTNRRSEYTLIRKACLVFSMLSQCDISLENFLDLLTISCRSHLGISSLFALTLWSTKRHNEKGDCAIMEAIAYQKCSFSLTLFKKGVKPMFTNLCCNLLAFPQFLNSPTENCTFGTRWLPFKVALSV